MDINHKIALRFSKHLTRDEVLTLFTPTREELIDMLIEKSSFGEEGDHLMEDGRMIFSRLSRDPDLRAWIERRKTNLLKYATVTGMGGEIKKIIAEYDMIIGFTRSPVTIPKTESKEEGPELHTMEEILYAWRGGKGKKEE